MVEFKSATGVTLEEVDLTKALDELLKPTDPPKRAAVKDTTETPSSSLESICPRLPPEGQAWLNGLNPFCRRAVEHDLRRVGPDLFVQYWESLRDTLQGLERDLVHPIIGSSVKPKSWFSFALRFSFRC
jgi:hypothetical protein